MATATAPLASGFTLTGTTFGRDTAPIFYTITGPSFGLAIGEQYSLAALRQVYQVTAADGKIEVYIDNLLLKRFDTSGEAASVTASISQAVVAIDRSIQQQATNAAPAPPPAPTPPPAARPANTNISNTSNTTSTAATTVVTTPTTVTVITEERTTTTSSGSRTITVPPTVPAATTAPDTTGDTIGFPPPIDSSLEGSPEFQEESTNLLTEPETIEDPDDLFSEEDDSFFTEDEDFADIDEEIDDTGDGEEGEEIVVTGRIDWRVKLSLAEGSEYLYNSPDAGVLEPLFDQNGVVFPYTPAINVNYVANYEPASIVHNNYKVYQYSNSAVDAVTITCEFTAQDTKEARYLLAVIHFFRSMTKMFYGQDQQPRAGTPPPLCYLRGMGTFQFKNHPLAITSFSYNLPNDVDYISTTGASTTGSLISRNNQSSSLRLPPNILPGGVAPPPTFTEGLTEGIYDFTLTWVPTKIQMAITCVPMMSRNDVSNEFSLEGYAQGNLYSDRGFW
jgi:hypothetical protein